MLCSLGTAVLRTGHSCALHACLLKELFVRTWSSAELLFVCVYTCVCVHMVRRPQHDGRARRPQVPTAAIPYGESFLQL